MAVIGIDRYASWPRLSNAVSDATAASELFQRLGFTEVVRPLLDGAATREAMWRLVTDDLAKLAADDSLVLFFAGHGHTRLTHPDGKPTKVGYVIPVDAAEQGDRAATWVRLDFWLNEVAMLPPRHILVFIDACHSGVALDAVVKWRSATLSTEALEPLQARRSRRIITSALDDQRAMDGGPYPGHSLFTGCLIDGLTSDLPARGQRVVTGSQIGLYLQQRVSSYPKSTQTPDFGALDFDQRGELVVPLLESTNESNSMKSALPPESKPTTTTQNEILVPRPPHMSPMPLNAKAGGGLVTISGFAFVAGLVVIGYAVTRPASGDMSDAQSAAMASAVARLDGDINTVRAAVRERAHMLSTILFVRTAVGIDAAAAADQVKGGELQFAPRDGEILELGRIVKATSAVEELMIQPAGAMHTAHEGMVGSYAELVGEQLVITEVAKVDPAYKADLYAGFLSVTRPLALGPALKSLVDAGITGQLVLGNKSVPIGKMPAGAATRDQPLGSQKDARLVVAEPPPHAAMPLPILVGGIGTAVVGLLLLVGAMASAPPATPARSRP